MTTRVHNDYLRTDSIKSSASRKYNETAFSSRIGEPAHELHYTDLLTRIERLDESFGVGSGDIVEDHADSQTAYYFTDIDGPEEGEASWH